MFKILLSFILVLNINGILGELDNDKEFARWLRSEKEHRDFAYRFFPTLFGYAKQHQNELTVWEKETAAQDASETKKNKHDDHMDRPIIYEPPITVDQLSAYRKGKPALGLPSDNLSLPDGSLKNLKSEYQRCFKKFEPVLAPITSKRPKRNTSLKLEDHEREFQSEYERSYVPVTESLYRPQLIRRCTNLKLEGPFYHVTDYRENFTAFLLEKKIKIQRKATTLKLLGQMNLETENRRNFVLYQNVFRPPLCKKLTNLHLSGSLHMDTENRDKFLRYKVQKHHPLTKMPSNLHLEGTLFLQPEYTSAFVEYKNYERQKPALPVNNIKSPFDFIIDSDSSENIQHPLIPHLRSYLHPQPDNPRRSSFRSISRPTSRPTSRPPSRSSDRFIDVEVDNSSRTDGKIYGLPTTVIVRSSEPKMIVSKSENNFSRWSSQNRTNRVGRENASSSRYFSKEEHAKSIAKSLPTLPRSNNWKLKVDGPEHYRSKPTSPEFQGRFECQPEYRKAYINYITRERINDQGERTASRWRNVSSPKEDALHEMSPLRKEQLRYRKSSPNLSTNTQKSLEQIETAAFGGRCRNSSVSEMSSSDSMIAAKKSQIPKWSKMHAMKPHAQQEESKSEPAFLVM